ncbi:hypothetical protein AGLY_012069 [Aphis glycines]|uniref:Uncharacterized protein n=1 Tax=Aphis glycines TaxID=307491 RepID=A0A6G0TB63_APHGL|nr:hypothetical protein AGLY_012069 [Aphis glycines]
MDGFTFLYNSSKNAIRTTCFLRLAYKQQNKFSFFEINFMLLALTLESIYLLSNLKLLKLNTKKNKPVKIICYLGLVEDDGIAIVYGHVVLSLVWGSPNISLVSFNFLWSLIFNISSLTLTTNPNYQYVDVINPVLFEKLFVCHPFYFYKQQKLCVCQPSFSYFTFTKIPFIRTRFCGFSAEFSNSRVSDFNLIKYYWITLIFDI